MLDTAHRHRHRRATAAVRRALSTRPLRRRIKTASSPANRGRFAPALTNTKLTKRRSLVPPRQSPTTKLFFVMRAGAWNAGARALGLAPVWGGMGRAPGSDAATAAWRQTTAGQRRRRSASAVARTRISILTAAFRRELVSRLEIVLRLEFVGCLPALASSTDAHILALDAAAANLTAPLDSGRVAHVTSANQQDHTQRQAAAAAEVRVRSELGAGAAKKPKQARCCKPHSTRAPDTWITCFHLAVSLLISAIISSGVPPLGTTPLASR